MNKLYSVEFKQLVYKSREMAIDMGYDYISTIHFFIADCESETAQSILKFGFTAESEFKKFKKDHALQKTDFLDMLDESLPLTKEAEKAIFLADAERIYYNQTEIYPCHFFLAALQNRESLLSASFKNYNNNVESLRKYYDELSAFEKSKSQLTKVSIVSRFLQKFRNSK